MTMYLSSLPERPRFLSEADGHAMLQVLARTARGGGETVVQIISQWTGQVRWARNRVLSLGEDRDNQIVVEREINGAIGQITINTMTDSALVAAARQAERLAKMVPQQVEADLATRTNSPFRFRDEPYTAPALFFDTTYQLESARRAAVARELAQGAAEVGLLSAGYLEVSATSTAYLTTWGYTRYYQYTWAQLSTTVRDPNGQGSGWAGVDWPDWSKIDAAALAATAREKCLHSRHPVAIEPGRYTTILEPQAVCDFLGLFIFANIFGRPGDEGELSGGLFWRSPGYSKLGERVIDERLTISVDPDDRDLGFPPFPKQGGGTGWINEPPPYAHPAVWIDRGVLTTLPYNHAYAVDALDRSTGLENFGALRMSGGNTTVADMIATTTRGLLVTRFDWVEGPWGMATICRGCTRDGLWLIEGGKITKAVKNMWFTESILFALNNVEQIGPAQRAFHPVPGGTWGRWNMNPKPAIVPPLKIRDFSFTSLSGAI